MSSLSFSTKNVLVTGGAGFIGSFLCEELLKTGAHVICVDSFVTSTPTNITHLLPNPNFEFIRHDINEPLSLESYPELERFKMAVQGVQEIYHLACPTSMKRFDEFRMETLLANSVGMRNVLDLAARYKAKFFHASTSVVYGKRPADGHPFREEEVGLVDQLMPRAAYDEGRRWAETMASTYAAIYGLDVRIGRIFRTYGPRMPLYDGHMIPDFAMAAIEGKDLTVYGDHGFRTTLAYVTDVVDGIMAIMKVSENPGPVNIGSDIEHSIGDIAEKIVKLVDSSSKVTYLPPLPYMHEPGLPDVTKAKDRLGWLSLVTLDQGLEKTVEYMRAHKDLLASPFG
jgi:UDP-glucuronate decarboxylase